MKEKIVIIGAGSAMFTRGLVADLLIKKHDAHLVLVDIDPVALEVAERLARKMIKACKSDMLVQAFVDRREALRDATCVICTIGVGGRRAWEQDVVIPRKYGIYVPVGDTIGPGGTSRALRMIPAMVEIAKDVQDLCPEALFFNYGNPMAAVCRGVRKATGANLIGLCHGVHHVTNYLADALALPPEKFRCSAVGMNHLTWFVEAKECTDNGAWMDAMPRLRNLASVRSGRKSTEELATRFAEAGTSNRGNVDSADDNPFSWRLLEFFGAFPACLDRHVTEFFPHLFPGGTYYGKQLGVDAYSFEKTIAYGDRCYAQMAEVANSSDDLPADYFQQISGEHEEVVEMIRDIRANRGTVYSANLPNTGQVPNLPLQAILESPAIADASGLRPLALQPLPPAIAGTLATRLQWVETIVDAALEGSSEKFIQALILDGYGVSIDSYPQLARDLLHAQSDYLPQFKK